MYFAHTRSRVKQWALALLAALVFIIGLATAQNVRAMGLDLAEAERLALANDPGIRSVESRSQALEEMSVASAQLPDPMLKVGVMSLPLDSFDFSQEPMTQAVLGVVQKFPRGDTRALKSSQMLQQAEMLDEAIEDQKLQIILAVRELYLEVIKQKQRAAINEEAIRIFTDFSDITRDYYATGRVNQQDVLQTVVELAKSEERARQIAEEEERARARLSAWLGEAAGMELAEEWPELQQPLDIAGIHEALKTHPRILALQKKVASAETGVELARQQYKPEFSVDLTYGGRTGSNMDGSSRADLFSVMLVMDLPLFHEKRQDRVTASMVAESSAAMFDRDDLYRRMKSEAELSAVTLEKQQQSIEFFTSNILPEARFSAESSFDAYQSSVGDLSSLLRAQITEIDLRLEFVRIQAEALKSQARLLYFQGENS